MSETVAVANDLEPVARGSLDRREGLVLLIRRVEEDRSGALGTKQFGIALAADRLLAELTGYLRVEPPVSPVTIQITGSDAELL